MRNSISLTNTNSNTLADSEKKLNNISWLKKAFNFLSKKKRKNLIYLNRIDDSQDFSRTTVDFGTERTASCEYSRTKSRSSMDSCLNLKRYSLFNSSKQTFENLNDFEEYELPPIITPINKRNSVNLENKKFSFNKRLSLIDNRISTELQVNESFDFINAKNKLKLRTFDDALLNGFINNKSKNPTLKFSLTPRLAQI